MYSMIGISQTQREKIEGSLKNIIRNGLGFKRHDKKPLFDPSSLVEN
jgi:hypothetical protein